MNTTTPSLSSSDDNLFQLFFNAENDSNQAFTSGHDNAAEVNDLHHDVGGPFSELVLFPFQVEVNDPEVNDPDPTLPLDTPESPPPPLKRKRGRPPNLNKKITQVTKKAKKYEEPPTSKSVRNAIGAKRNRDLKKEAFAKMQSENESLNAQNLALTNQVVALLAEKEDSDARISKLTAENENYRKRFDLILKNALFGGEKVDHVDDHVVISSADITSGVGMMYSSPLDDNFEGPDSLAELDQLLGLDKILETCESGY
ncbi:uncharacterized protein LOC110854617 [Folsomia candida]|uniref:BZIP domain-containing protein n=1 Tax=Folsomia candida TaxID=158441 RepID=A0A226DXS9_FOLCA|nr:uncharacterized protein LOC110854617 [Folsomia candida]OXA49604.1 hypothetical protein Fcan01_15461 [Folsomia candida]